MAPGLTALISSNVVWAGVEAAVAGGLSFASAFVIARLIGPGEFGIAAAAVALHVMLWVGCNALLADALVQRPALDDDAAATAFWTSIGMGIVCALIQAAAGWAIARAMSDTRLIAMSLLLALPLPLVGAGGVAQGLLTRRRAYRLLAARAIVGQGLGTAVGLGAALAGAGAWAPVSQQCVISAAGAATLLVGIGWRPRAVWRWPALRELLQVGGPLTASTLVLAARYRLFVLLLGGTAGAAALGETHMAFRLVETVRELCSAALWRLTLPVLSECQSDPAALRAAVDRLLQRTSAVTLPLTAAMALGLPAMVQRLLGPAWLDAAHAAEPLVAVMAMLLLMFPSGAAVVARGQTGRALLGNAACLLLTLGGVVWTRPVTAGQAVAVWCIAQLAVTPYTLWVNGRAIGTGPLRPLRAGMAMLWAALAGLATAALLRIAAGDALDPVFLATVQTIVLGAVLLGVTAFRLHARRTARPAPAPLPLLPARNSVPPFQQN